MGRPRLYNSPEEKAAANRLKSKKYYEKKKRAINRKRRREYARLHPAESNEAVPEKVDNVVSTTSAVDPLASWLEGVERVRRGLNRMVGEAPQDYVEEICTAFLEHKDKDRIYEKIVKLGKLQKSIYRYHAEVYALAGVGPETERADAVLSDIRRLLNWVEEVFCYAMVDFQEVQERYVRREFMYQVE